MRTIESQALCLSSETLSACEQRISHLWGLHFPSERWHDLSRYLAQVADEMGYNNLSTFISEFLRGTPRRELSTALLRHLTIGETYFLRDPIFFDQLTQEVLEPLIAKRRRQGTLYLKLWSAGCCTGEEAYSLAVVLNELLPDVERWNVEIIGTDINTEFLKKARSGIYSAWSFRQVPAGWEQRYFDAESGSRWRIKNEIRQKVQFLELNLATADFPDSRLGLENFDIILCRNVLMYFSPAKAGDVLQKLYSSMVSEGVLMLAAVESMPCQWGDMKAEIWPGALCLRKKSSDFSQTSVALEAEIPPRQNLSSTFLRRADIPATQVLHKPFSIISASERASAEATLLKAEQAFEQGAYDLALSCLDQLAPHSNGESVFAVRISLLRARIHADCGNLGKAVEWAEKAIATDRTNPDAYWLLASVHLEQGHITDAEDALTKVLYLKPDFILAHYLSGLINLQLSRKKQALRQLLNCKHLAEVLPRESMVPQGDGLSVAVLLNLVSSAINQLKVQTEYPELVTDD